MHVLNISTSSQKQVIDITEILNDTLQKWSWNNGLLFLFIKHTTAAITTADLDSGTDLDMLDAFEKIIPQLQYRHAHDPSHVSDHILSSLIGTSLNLPIQSSRLLLGTWQRVILVELNGPRDREIIASFQSA